MPATRTPRKMTARELEAARARVRDQFFAPYQAAQQFGLQLPGMLRGIGKEALGAFRAGTEYVLDPNTQKDVPKDINRVGKAAAQNLGSYLDIFNSVYQAIDNEGMVAKPDYYRNLIGGMYQERFKPEPSDPRLERAASFYADPLALAGVGGRAARGLADPALYRQIADELGGANRAYAIENLWHGTPHTYPAERLVRMPDGSEQYIVGGVDSLPSIPKGATVIRDFPLGRQRLDKIGTGEGAQAYGHGIYEAESKRVAESYAENLAKNPTLTTADGRTVKFSAPSQKGLKYALENSGDRHIEPWQEVLANNGGNNRKAIAAAKKQAQEAADSYQRMKAIGIDDKSTANSVEYWSGIVDALKANGRGAKYDPGTRMYQTRLAWPDPAREAATPLKPEDFLDWDKPLSEQPQKIKQAIYNDLIDAGYRESIVNDLLNRKSGMDLYKTLYTGLQQGETPAINLAKMLNLGEDGMFLDAPALASESLKRMGIPGIRYLDAGSRGAGEGSRNYVVFDDKLIDIVSRNNQPIKK